MTSVNLGQKEKTVHLWEVDWSKSNAKCLLLLGSLNWGGKKWNIFWYLYWSMELYATGFAVMFVWMKYIFTCRGNAQFTNQVFRTQHNIDSEQTNLSASSQQSWNGNLQSQTCFSKPNVCRGLWSYQSSCQTYKELIFTPERKTWRTQTFRSH